MRIPKKNLTHGFIAEILDLFQLNAITSDNNHVLIKDNYLYYENSKRKSYT